MTAGRLRPKFWPGPQTIAVVLILGLFAALAIEPTRQLLQQRERLTGMSQDLQQVERSNNRLESRIERLKNPSFLEQRARSLGLVRPGETTYIVMPPGRADNKNDKRKRRETAPPPPEPGFIESFLQFLGIP